MAAYEVLLLNTAIPQIQAAQSGDTYVVPRDIAINATAIISANSATDALRITQTGAGNAILVEDSANPDSTPFVVTAAGDVGIGTSSPSDLLHLNRNTTTATVQRITNTGGTALIGVENADGTGIISGAGAYDTVIRTASGTGVSFGIGYSPPAMRLNPSGNLGLGVTPSAWGSGYAALQIKQTALYTTATEVELGSNHFVNSSGQFAYIGNGFATRYEQYLGAHSWHTAPNNTSGAGFAPISFTQAMTLDASGNLGIGTTNPVAIGANYTTLDLRGSTGGGVRFGNTTDSAYLYSDSSATVIATNTSKPMVLAMNSLEKARITTGGYFKASNNGTYVGSTGAYHELVSSEGGATAAVYIRNTNASSPAGIDLSYSAASPNGTGNVFLYCQDSTALRASIRSNGGLANYQSNNVDLSDARTKTDINPLASYWNKIAALEIVTYKYKDQTHDDLNIGVIAQQIEQVAPEFVDADGFGETPEDGVPLKTIYNKDLTFAAIKALQEAMARIETLEAEVAALKGA